MSGTPVLIAACNEEATLAQTLERLPRDVKPHVILNGCTDQTADVARSYADSGVVVLESDPGKMAALQAGIRTLGTRAMDPLITLDADSYPIFPERWTSALSRGRAALNLGKPAVVVGGAVYHGHNSLAGNIVSTTMEGLRQHQARHQHDKGNFPGRNMLIHLQSMRLVDAALAAPNLWPGEDQFFADLAVAGGGHTRKLGGVASAVWTLGDRQPGFWSRITTTRAQRQATISSSYAASGIPGVTVPYPGSELCGQLLAQSSTAEAA